MSFSSLNGFSLIAVNRLTGTGVEQYHVCRLFVRIGKMSDSVVADGLIECCPDEWQTVVNGVCKIHLSG